MYWPFKRPVASEHVCLIVTGILQQEEGGHEENAVRSSGTQRS